jgi:hypothetical protein
MAANIQAHEWSTAPAAAPSWQRTLLWGALAGLGAVVVLTTAVLLRYPGGPRARVATLSVAVLAFGAVALLALGARWSVRRA